MTLDRREWLLVRLQDVLKTLAPGVTYTFPDGLPHRPIETNLHGRVYSRQRTEARVDVSEMPFVELLTAASAGDTVTALDSDFYAADLRVEIYGYVRSENQGDSLDSDVRAKLNALRADLLVAVEAFPYWTSGGTVEPATRRLGPIETVLTSQWTEPAADYPDGYLILEFVIRYVFNRKQP